MERRDRVAHDEIAKEYPEILVKEGEVDVYDPLILSDIIRKKEFQIISKFISINKRGIILDYGCGPGWLSRFLSGKGLRVVGIEINSSLLEHAKYVCPPASFVTCDAHVLPFKDKTYDSVLGISILHHLRLDVALRELRRATKSGSSFMFMEPNPLNFLSAFGRRFFPTEAHTVSEKPFLSSHLAKSLRVSGMRDIKTVYIFFISFPLARLYKILGRKPSAFIVRLIGLTEKVLERLSLLRKMNSTTVVRGAF